MTMKIPHLDLNKKECKDGYILKWPFRLLVIGDSSRGKTKFGFVYDFIM